MTSRDTRLLEDNIVRCELSSKGDIYRWQVMAISATGG